MIGAGSLAAVEQPYASLDQRPIKALSDADIDDYLNGRGMSLALAAELNGHPGPRHVLDLAESLRLTVEQRRLAETLFAEMQAEAIALGERIVAEEAALDRQFAEATADAGTIADAADRIGRLGGALRAVHLRTHVSMRAALTAGQLAAYDRLRGYGPPTGGEPGNAGQTGHGDHGGHN
ncbi:MAG: hypothetical protein HKM95_16315 [Inquilinus sp.]|nr:hypothetical protein [Inquilinus sp.]